MKSILTAAIAFSALGCAAPATVHAAGQPQLSATEAARATSGKTPDQAAQSTMELKREKDANKFQNQASQQSSQANAAHVGDQQAGPSPAPAPQATTDAVKKNP